MAGVAAAGVVTAGREVFLVVLHPEASVSVCVSLLLLPQAPLLCWRWCCRLSRSLLPSPPPAGRVSLRALSRPVSVVLMRRVLGDEAGLARFFSLSLSRLVCLSLLVCLPAARFTRCGTEYALRRGTS